MEVRTQPVNAVPLGKAAFHAENLPGSFFLGDTSADDEHVLWYRCPCGCGSIGRLLVGDGGKPAMSPSWHWNGSLAKPSLQPSVHQVGHWHGWLTDGVWRSV